MAREPFKSGVTDYEALYKRVGELGIRRPAGDKNGVDVTPPTPEKEETPLSGTYTYGG